MKKMGVNTLITTLYITPILILSMRVPEHVRKIELLFFSTKSTDK